MKWILPGLWILTGTLFGQGTVIFSNSSANLVRFDPDPARVQAPNVPGDPVPAGARFMVGFYFAPAGTADPSSLVPFTGTVQIGPTAGLYRSATLPILIPDTSGVFQVRVWESANGTSYEQALSRGTGYLGTTPLFTAPLTGTSPINVGALAPEIHVAFVPEPSTLALIAAGTAGLFLGRRRRG